MLDADGGSTGWDVCVGVLFLCFGFTHFRRSLKMEIGRKVESIRGEKIPPTSFFCVGVLMLRLVRFVLCLFFYQSSYESVPKSLFDDVLHFCLLRCGEASVTFKNTILLSPAHIHLDPFRRFFFREVLMQFNVSNIRPTNEHSNNGPRGVI